MKCEVMMSVSSQAPSGTLYTVLTHRHIQTMTGQPGKEGEG